jgi:hypothetical protein
MRIMALVVIEGVDKTGKSTLAERVRGELTKDGRPCNVIHFGPPKAGAVEEYLGPLLEYEPSKQHIVYDRAHLGEAVWPKYFDRETKMSPSERALIELFMLACGAVTVLCVREPLSLLQAFEEADPPEPLPTDRVYDAADDFTAEFERVLGQKFIYDHASARRDAQLINIVSHARLQSEMALQCRVSPGQFRKAIVSTFGREGA